VNLKKAFQARHSGEGRNPVREISVEETKSTFLIPAFAGMTNLKKMSFNFRF